MIHFRKSARLALLAAGGSIALGMARAQIPPSASVQAPDPPPARGLVPKANATQPSHLTRIILLGTGAGPIVHAFRSQPATLLVVDGRPYLIDAGSGVSRQLVRAGFRPPQIRHIFLTHLHIDHDAGLPALMSFIWFEGRFGSPGASHTSASGPVQIYGPPATGFLVQTALRYLGVSERIFRAGMPAMPAAAPMFSAHDVDLGKDEREVYRDDLIRVIGVQNTHYHAYSGSPETGQDKSYSYRFETPAGVVFITGDTGPSDAVMHLAKNADVMVSEVLNHSAQARVPGAGVPRRSSRGRDQAGSKLRTEIAFHMKEEHLTPEAVGQMAVAAHVKMVILTHIASGTDAIPDMAPFTAGVSRYFKGPVVGGRDFFEYDLMRFSK